MGWDQDRRGMGILPRNLRGAAGFGRCGNGGSSPAGHVRVRKKKHPAPAVREMTHAKRITAVHGVPNRSIIAGSHMLTMSALRLPLPPGEPMTTQRKDQAAPPADPIPGAPWDAETIERLDRESEQLRLAMQAKSDRMRTITPDDLKVRSR